MGRHSSSKCSSRVCLDKRRGGDGDAIIKKKKALNNNKRSSLAVPALPGDDCSACSSRGGGPGGGPPCRVNNKENSSAAPAFVLPELDPAAAEEVRALPPAPGAQVPLLPPRPPGDDRITLVLDLDETLVHCSLDPLDDADFAAPVGAQTVYIRVRPGVEDFLRFASRHFEVVAFTAGLRRYSSEVLRRLDPRASVFRHRLFRDACFLTRGRRFVKDLSALGRDLRRTAIVDNAVESFGFQPDNGVLVGSWYGDRADRQLEALAGVLAEMAGECQGGPAATTVPEFLRARFGIARKINSFVT